MMCFPSMLLTAAEKVGMPTPELKNGDEFDHEAFLRFHIYCCVQLNRPIQWGEHWENAEVIMKVPEDKLKTVTLKDLLALGLRWQQ